MLRVPCLDLLMYIFLATDMFYTAFPKDKFWIKILVYSVYLLDMIQTIMITWDCFHTFVFGFNDMKRLDSVGLLWFDLCFLDGIGERLS